MHAEREGGEVVDVAEALLEWIRLRGDRYSYNDAPSYGALTVEIAVGADSIPLFKVWTDGNLQVMFSALTRTKAFVNQDAPVDLMTQSPRAQARRSRLGDTRSPLNGERIAGNTHIWRSPKSSSVSRGRFVTIWRRHLLDPRVPRIVERRGVVAVDFNYAVPDNVVAPRHHPLNMADPNQRPKSNALR